jgi:hypothetical protein
LQLDTYGSAERAYVGKVSQSIQLDERGADALVEVLFAVFPTLKIDGRLKHLG